MSKINPFKNLVLDKEEQKIEKALEKGEFKSVDNFETRKKLFEEAARHYIDLQKTKRITLRINKGDLIKMKAKARRNQIPYQRLINVLIHQYTEGKARITI